jgi:hypothetical protein
MTRQHVWIPVICLCLFALSACGIGSSSEPSQPSPLGETEATPGTASTPTVSPSPATPTTSPSPAEPTPLDSPGLVAGGSYLEIEGTRPHQVVIPDSDFPAEYAVTASGVYRSSFTSSWIKVSDKGGSERIIADPIDSDFLYRGDHPPCARGGEPVPFETSADGGTTWTTIPSGENVRPLIIEPTNTDVIYGDNCSLTISVDAGQTWTTHQPVPSFDLSSLSLAGDQLYGIYTSEGGTSRLVVTDVTDPANPTTGAPLLEFWGGGAVIVSPDRVVVGESHGVHVSNDGDRTWTFSRAGLEQVTVSVDARTEPIPTNEISTEFGIFAVAVHPANPDQILAGTIRGLFRSEDGGQAWSAIPEVGETRVRDLAFANGGDQLYVTTNDGVVVIENP